MTVKACLVSQLRSAGARVNIAKEYLASLKRQPALLGEIDEDKQRAAQDAVIARQHEYNRLLDSYRCAIG